MLVLPTLVANTANLDCKISGSDLLVNVDRTVSSCDLLG
jgi:hypothetical protein